MEAIQYVKENHEPFYEPVDVSITDEDGHNYFYYLLYCVDSYNMLESSIGDYCCDCVLKIVESFPALKRMCKKSKEQTSFICSNCGKHSHFKNPIFERYVDFFLELHTNTMIDKYDKVIRAIIKDFKYHPIIKRFVDCDIQNLLHNCVNDFSDNEDNELLDEFSEVVELYYHTMLEFISKDEILCHILECFCYFDKQISIEIFNIIHKYYTTEEIFNKMSNDNKKIIKMSLKYEDDNYMRNFIHCLGVLKHRKINKSVLIHIIDSCY